MNKNIMKVGFWIAGILTLSVLWNTCTGKSEGSKKIIRAETFASSYTLEMTNTSNYLSKQERTVEYQVTSRAPYVVLEYSERKGYVGFWANSYKSSIRFDPKTLKGTMESYDIHARQRYQKHSVSLQRFGKGFIITFKDFSTGRVTKGKLTPTFD